MPRPSFLLPSLLHPVRLSACSLAPADNPATPPALLHRCRCKNDATRGSSTSALPAHHAPFLLRTHTLSPSTVLSYSHLSSPAVSLPAVPHWGAALELTLQFQLLPAHRLPRMILTVGDQIVEWAAALLHDHSYHVATTTIQAPKQTS